MTPNIVAWRRMRDRQREVARRTRDNLEWEKARRLRNCVARKMKNADKYHLKKDLANWGANSKNAWAAVSEHLGWRKPCAPTMLVKEGKVLKEPDEMAEAMQAQFEEKEKEVEDAVGPPRYDYLTPVRLATTGNVRKFEFKLVTEAEVARKIAVSPNKESFGNDEVSYGVLKRMVKLIVPELTRIYNLSIRTSTFPTQWKVGRVKPLYKGAPALRTATKSCRPVCLLSAAARVLEGLLAKQMDDHAEKLRLNHRGIHGYRAGRGTATAILEFQEDVLWATEKGLLLGLGLLDVSAGFDSVPHINLLRKLQVGFGYCSKTLKWLADYLEGRRTYISVEAERSRSRRMTRGIPQGGPLCPSLWRCYLAELPEAGKVWWGSMARVVVEATEEIQEEPEEKCLISEMVDSKSEEELTEEEKFDQKMRREGHYRIEAWTAERGGLGSDQWRHKKVEDQTDMVMTLYADDSANRVVAKNMLDLKRRMTRGLERVFRSMQASRLKVNADKTTYLVIAGPGRRTREDLRSTLGVGREKIQAVRVGKSLGLLINDNLTWEAQTQKVVAECRTKM